MSFEKEFILREKADGEHIPGEEGHIAGERRKDNLGNHSVLVTQFCF